MAVSQTAEYALRAVVWLAQNPGAAQTTQQIAEAACLSANYLPKVLQPLVRNGMVRGHRGVGGGYTLVADPSALTVLEVINAVDPIQRIETCPLHRDHEDGGLCPLHRLLDDAVADAEDRFSRITIAQLVAGYPSV